MAYRFGARSLEEDQGDVGERGLGQSGRWTEGSGGLLGLCHTPLWASSDGCTITVDRKLRMKCFKQRCSVNTAGTGSSACLIQVREFHNSCYLPVPVGSPLQREFQGINVRIRSLI